LSELVIRAKVEDQASEPLKEIGDNAKQMADDVAGTSEAGKELAEGFDQAAESGKNLGESLEATGESASGMAEGMGEAGEALGTVGESAETAGEGVGTMGESLTTAGEEATSMGENMDTMGESLTTAGEEATTTGDELTTMGEALTEAGEEATTTGDELDTMGEALATAGDEAGTAAEDLDTMGDSLDTAGESAETAGGNLDTMAEATATAGDNAGTAEGTIEGLGDASDTAGDAAGTAAGSLDSMADAESTAGDNAGTASGEVDTLGDSADTAGESAGTAAGSLDTMADSASTAGDNSATAEGEISGMGDSADTAGESASTAAGSLDTLGESATTAGDNAATADGEISSLGDSADTAGESAGTAAGSLDTLGESATTAGDNSATAEGEISGMGDSADTAGESAGGAAGSLDTLGESASTAGDNSATAGDQIDTLSDSASDASDSVGDLSADLDAVGGSADAAVGGLTPANTLVGDIGETSETTAGKITGMTGQIAAVGATVGTTVSTLFRYQDAQLALDRANLKLEKSQEAARKAVVAFDTLLGKAKTNTDGIATATDTYKTALGNLNALQDAGVTSGAEYEAAQAALAEAIADLKAEFVAGEGDANKFEGGLKKIELTSQSSELAVRSNEKAHRTFNQTLLDTGLSAVALAGNFTTMVSNSDKLSGVFSKLTGGTTSLTGKIGALGAEIYLLYAAFEAVKGVAKAVEMAQAAAAGEMEKSATASKDGWDQMSSSLTPVGGQLDGIAVIAKALGFDIDEALDKGVKKGKEMDQQNKEVKNSAVDLGNGYSVVNGVIRKTADVQDELAAAQAEGAGAATEVASATAVYSTEADNASQLTEEEAGAMGNLIGTAQENISSHADMAHALELFSKTQLNADQAIEEANLKYAESVDALADLKAVMGDAGAMQDAINTKVNETKVALGEEEIALRGTIKAYQDSGVVAQEYENALLEIEANLRKNTVENNAAAEATLAFADSNLNVQEAISEVNLAYAESVDKLADLNAVMSDSGAMATQLATKVNEHEAALKEEEIALRASIQGATDKSLILQELDTAYLRGAESITSWVTELATAAEEERGAKEALAAMGLELDDFPSHMDPTIENLKKYTEALLGGGQAAIDFQMESLASFERFTGDMRAKIDDLVGISNEGGEKLKESTDKWFADLEAELGRKLTPAERKFIDTTKNMVDEGNTAFANFNLDAMQNNIDGGIDKMEATFREAAATNEGTTREMFTSMANIAATGSQEAVATMQQIWESGAAPEKIVEAMKVLETEFPNIGEVSMTELIAKMKEKGLDIPPELEKIAGEGGTAAGKGFETEGGVAFGQAWQTILGAVKEAFTEMPTFYAENTIAPMVEAMTPLAEGWQTHLASLKEAFTEMPTFYSESTIAPMVEALVPLAEGWLTHFESLHEAFTEMPTFYADKTVKPMTEATNKFSTDVTTQMKTKFGATFGDINTKANTSITTMQTKFITMNTKVNQEMTTKFGKTFGDINTKANTSITTMQNKFISMNNTVNSQITSKFASSFQKVASDGQSAANKIKSAFDSMISSVQSKFNSMISSMESKISALESRAASAGGGGVSGGGGGGGGGGLFGQHGLHTTLPRDTTIFAHAGERVDIYPKGSIKPGPRSLPPIATGGQPLSINLNVSQQVDGKEFSRLMGRYYMDGYSGA
jgi:hypothetical protein